MLPGLNRINSKSMPDVVKGRGSGPGSAVATIPHRPTPPSPAGSLCGRILIKVERSLVSLVRLVLL